MSAIASLQILELHAWCDVTGFPNTVELGCVDAFLIIIRACISCSLEPMLFALHQAAAFCSSAFPFQTEKLESVSDYFDYFVSDEQ